MLLALAFANSRLPAAIVEKCQMRISHRHMERDDRVHHLRVSKNLLRNTIAHTIEGGLFIGAMQFVSAATLAPKLIESLGGPVWLIALMPVIGSIGFVCPQIFVAHRIAQWRRHKPFVALSGVFQRLPYLIAALMLMMAAAAPNQLVIATVALAPLLSGLAGGFTFTGWQELVAKTVPAERRAGIWAARNIIGAIIGLVAGVAIKKILVDWPGATGYGVLHLITFGVLVLSYVVFLFVRETPYPDSHKTEALTFGQSIRLMPALVRDDANLRAYLFSNAFWAGIYIVLPFMSIHALAVLGKEADFLGYLIGAGMVGSLIGNTVAGFIGNRMGGKVVMTISHVGYMLAVAWVIFARTEWEFMAIFVLQSAMTVCNAVGTTTLGIEMCPKQRRVIYLTVMAIFGIGATLISPIIAGQTWKLLGESYRFTAVSVLSIVAVAISMALLAKVKEPRSTWQEQSA